MKDIPRRGRGSMEQWMLTRDVIPCCSVGEHRRYRWTRRPPRLRLLGRPAGPQPGRLRRDDHLPRGARQDRPRPEQHHHPPGRHHLRPQRLRPRLRQAQRRRAPGPRRQPVAAGHRPRELRGHAPLAVGEVTLGHRGRHHECRVLAAVRPGVQPARVGAGRLGCAAGGAA